MIKPLDINGMCDAECPVSRASDVLSGKWTTLIIRDLLSGTKRYSELQRSLTGISPRMLAARLTMLEEAGLIAKTIYPTVPPKTEYTLTENGKRIEPVIAAMAEFGAGLLRAKWYIDGAGFKLPQARPSSASLALTPYLSRGGMGRLRQ